ncbi:hypothetical protein TL16_g01001 [Triparma laevis f. inornata]|uniref:TPR-like protein n=2 Tax=Triparma laevis TaxID=1534972 RepID=A0A9W6ZX08_9STRA|nr:hypothetical protein TL16_g01001 [Triparma laevis f. inornata]GMH58515.1 hypothetical protein TrLO_g830 [Triparma laevis f. longispina]
MSLMASLSTLKGPDDPNWDSISSRLAELKTELAAPPPPPSAEAFKAEGNGFFKAGKYVEAIEKYKLATSVDPNVPTYWSNMSASYEKLGNFGNAAEAGRSCIKADGKFIKGYFRLATALKALNDIEECTHVLHTGLEVDPTHADLKKLLHEVSELKVPPLSLFDLLTTQTFDGQTLKLEPSDVKLSRFFTDFSPSPTLQIPDCPPNDTSTTRITSHKNNNSALIPALLSECAQIKASSTSIAVSNAGGYHSPESWICDLSRGSSSSDAWTVCKSGERFKPMHELVASSLTLHTTPTPTPETPSNPTNTPITPTTLAPDLDSHLLLRFQNVRFTHDYTFTPIKPSPGTITTFPGYVPHCVMPTSRERRVTLAFNIKQVGSDENKMSVTGWFNENGLNDYNRLHNHGDCEYAMVFNVL